MHAMLVEKLLPVVFGLNFALLCRLSCSLYASFLHLSLSLKGNFATSDCRLDDKSSSSESAISAIALRQPLRYKANASNALESSGLMGDQDMAFSMYALAILNSLQ